MLWLIQRQLKSKRVSTRRRVVQRLGESPQPRHLFVLRLALDDADSQVRRLAAEALSKVDDMDRIGPLLHALRDQDADVVKAAIVGVKDMKDERIIAALPPLLRHLDAGVRGSAALTLRHNEWNPKNPDDDLWFLISQGQFARAAAHGAAAVSALETVLLSGPYSLGVGAVSALGTINDPRVFEPLASAVNASDASICVAAVDALFRQGGAQVIEPLTDALRHTNAHVRVAAAEALGKLGASSAAAPLRALLKDSSWDARRASAEALGRLNDADSVEALAATLNDKDGDVREAAAIALGELNDRRAIAPLVLALKDTTSGVRRIAAAALARIDENWSVSTEARAVFQQLKLAMHDEEPEVRNYVSQLLVSVGEIEPQDETAREAFEAAGSTAEKRRKLSVSLFVAVLCDADAELRQAAAEALGRLGDTRAQPALARAIRDPEPNVKYAAETALASLVPS